MPTRTRVKRSDYYDSVTLMLVAKALLEMPGVEDAAVVMATAANKEILEQANLLVGDALMAGADDLVIAVRAGADAVEEQAFITANELLVSSRQRRTVAGAARRARSLAAALNDHPTANVVVISVSGQYAAQEARTALAHGRHVLLFSDNVPLAEEIALKQLAQQRGLLMMGPDAGTAIVNGVALGFANAVPRGPVGIVGAAGTGIQGVTSALARRGVGISQALGTGGRDLKVEVGGLMMQQGLRALLADPATEVVVLISKPPAPEVMTTILHLIGGSDKPVVVCFLGGDASLIEAEGGIAAASLEEAVRLAAALVQQQSTAAAKGKFHRELLALAATAQTARATLKPEARFVRGLFCGGTFCYEAQMLLLAQVSELYSNAPFPGVKRLPSALISSGHSCIDLGEDEFTQGRLHPMLDPTLRNKRLLQEAADPSVGVILLDLVLGYGAHDDPAGALAAAIAEARQRLAAAQRDIAFVASVCGTADDPQNLADQEAKLRAVGVLVVESNAAAATLAGMIVR